MIEDKLNYICPCCGFKVLSSRAYEKDIFLPVDSKLVTPYSCYFGGPSYEVCDCCGYEYGFDNEPGTAHGTTFYDYLKNWIRNGCIWFNSERRSKDWSLIEQLQGAKIPITFESGN